MKKKILIVNNNMHIGGVQKALVNLLRSLSCEYDITLFLFNKSGECLRDVPENVQIIEAKSGYKYLGLTKHDVKGHPIKFLMRSFYAFITRIFSRSAALLIMGIFQKKLRGYDIAFSYLHNGSDKAFYGGCNEFVLKKVIADKKITLLHCDYLKCGANTSTNGRQYAAFDIIAACSKGCRASFIKALPELSAKTEVLLNCHDYSAITRMSSEARVELNGEYINILTVARLGREKGVLRALNVISQLNDTLRAKIRYYIIGDGIQMPDAKQFIADHNLGDIVTCLGEMSNPYGYMKACDLLLISSLSEAAPLVIGESAFLGTPVLSTETSSAHEMITETDYGWVCDNSEEALLNKLEMLLSDPEEIRAKGLALLQKEFNNNTAIEQFKRIIN